MRFQLKTQYCQLLAVQRCGHGTYRIHNFRHNLLRILPHRGGHNLLHNLRCEDHTQEQHKAHTQEQPRRNRQVRRRVAHIRQAHIRQARRRVARSRQVRSRQVRSRQVRSQVRNSQFRTKCNGRRSPSVVGVLGG